MECPHCGCPWNDGDKCPRILYCGHIFCETCLRAWLKDGTSVTCEICGKATSVHQGDLSYLIPVKHLAEAQKSQNAQVEGMQPSSTDLTKNSQCHAASGNGESFSPPIRTEQLGNASAPDSGCTDSADTCTAQTDVTGQPEAVKALPTDAPVVGESDEVKASRVDGGADLGQESTAASELSATSSNSACDDAPEKMPSTSDAFAADVPSPHDSFFWIRPHCKGDVPVDSFHDGSCSQDATGKQLALGPREVSAVENPWSELVEHSAAIVEHTVGAVVCVAQGLAEADRQLGISNAVVDGVVEITRRVSGTLAPDPALTGDNSRSNQDGGGSAVCVVS